MPGIRLRSGFTIGQQGVIREGYIELPKPGTNPRGVEITKEALEFTLAAPPPQSHFPDFPCLS